MKRQVRFVLLIVLACGLASGCSARREREATLKQNLFMMRQAIDKYTLDEERAPQNQQGKSGTRAKRAENPFVWSRGVARWFRWSLSVADPFVSRCLTSSALLPFPHPAHRTGRADLPHPALGEDSRNRRSHCM